MAVRSQPRDQLHQVFPRHCRTASGWPIDAAANMKKNRASCARHVRIVSEHLADREDSRRRAAISFLLSKTRLVLAGEPRAPGDPVFSKQHRDRSSDRNPLSAAVFLE